MVVPIILGVVIAVLAIGWLISWYRQPPKEENPTVLRIEKRLQDEEARREKKKQEKREKERKEEERKLALQALREEQVSLKAEREKSKEQAELAERKRVEGKKMEGDAKEAEWKVEREKELQRLRDLEEEMKAMKEKERQLEEETKAAKEEAEKERAARREMENGRQPTKWPTRKEFEDGRKLIQYNKKNLHFAIVGKSGSGKSSLINGFLNRTSNQSGAAATGVTETTSTIGRYPDPGEQAPRPWTVWYDVPGAGTQNVSAWQYFINQGLFVFDIILIAIGDRFEETDIQLLKDCNRFNIPALIVRSKADMHIDNLVKEEGGWGESVDRQTYKRCRKTFITDSRQMVRNELRKAGLDEQEVYLVSSYTLRAVYNRALEGSEDNLPFNMIDEKKLVQAIMFLTIQRRRGNDPLFRRGMETMMRGNAAMTNMAQTGRDWSESIQAASSRTLNALLHRGRSAEEDEDHTLEEDHTPHEDRTLHESHTPDEDRSPDEAPPGYQEYHPERANTYPSASSANRSNQRPNTNDMFHQRQEPGNTRPRSGTPAHSNRGFVHWIKHVIHLPQPVKLPQLQHELAVYNPDLARISAAPPRMLSPKTYVLNFLPGQNIPDAVEAFGSVLPLEPFRERGGQNNGYGEGSSGGGTRGRGGAASNRGQGRGGRNHQSEKRAERSEGGRNYQSAAKQEGSQRGRNYRTAGSEKSEGERNYQSATRSKESQGRRNHQSDAKSTTRSEGNEGTGNYQFAARSEGRQSGGNDQAAARAERNRQASVEEVTEGREPY